MMQRPLCWRDVFNLDDNDPPDFDFHWRYVTFRCSRLDLTKVLWVPYGPYALKHLLRMLPKGDVCKISQPHLKRASEVWGTWRNSGRMRTSDFSYTGPQ
jgi:hypothetical protein